MERSCKSGIYRYHSTKLDKNKILILMTFSLFFKPKHNYFLERIGKENDGGYLINSEAIIKSDYLLSFGIFDDWSFEKILLNITIMQKYFVTMMLFLLNLYLLD